MTLAYEVIKVYNAQGHPCLRPNPARADGLWPGGPFYMVGNHIYFHQQDAEAAAKRPVIEEKGPWTAGRWEKDGRVFVQSADFTHDVLLYVDGDFESDRQKWDYACGIAKRLNSAAKKAPSLAMIGRMRRA